MYDYYNEGTNFNFGIWQYFAAKSLSVEQGVFYMLIQAAVFISGMSLIFSAIALILSSHGIGQKLTDSKVRIVRVFIISVLVFSVSGFVMLLERMGLDF